MAGREHPAARAGRFVRAAGRASAAAAREFEKTTAARPTTARPTPTPKPAAAPPPPAPPFPTGGVIGRTAFAGLIGAIAALVLVGLKVDSLIHPAATRLTYRLIVVAILSTEAGLLLANWRGATQSLVQRFCNRVWGRRGAETRREKAFARAVRDAVTLIGLCFLAAGVYELIVATIGT